MQHNPNLISIQAHRSSVLHQEPLGERGVRVEVLERLALLLREFLPLQEVLPQEHLHLGGNHIDLAAVAMRPTLNRCRR